MSHGKIHTWSADGVPDRGVVRTVANQRVVRKMNAYMAEAERGVDDRIGSRATPLRIENGSYGREQPREIRGSKEDNDGWSNVIVGRLEG